MMIKTAQDLRPLHRDLDGKSTVMHWNHPSSSRIEVLVSLMVARVGYFYKLQDAVLNV